MAPVKVLCIADVHLGRRPSKLPERWDAADFSPRMAWADIVQTALDHEVDAVVVAGDLVDRENKYAEAYGAVESVTSTLGEAGIPLFAVAGNHDYDVVPDLADAIDGIQLLGRNGEWERKTLIGNDGETRLQIDGWSFPSRHYHENPLTEYDLDDEDVPQLGVAHADLSGDEDRYAPVDVDTLTRTGHAAWLLGHLHISGVRHESPTVLYPGSLQPLDSTETGDHGAWLLTIDANGSVDTHPLSSATLQYEQIVISTEPDQGFHDVVDATHTKLRTTVAESSSEAELLAAEVIIEGRTESHTDLLDRRTELEQIELTEDGTAVRVVDVAVDTTPAVDLTEQAGEDNPVGYLAGLLRALDGDEPLEPYQDVIEAAHESARETHESNAYRELQTHDETYSRPTKEETKAVLQQQTRILINTFLDQQEVTADE